MYLGTYNYLYFCISQGPSYEDKEVPKHCLENEQDSQTEKCEEPCEESQAQGEEEEE